MIHIQYPVSVEYLEGWNLLVTFDNSEQRVYNCDDIPSSSKEVEQPLKNIENFKKAHINKGILEFNEDVDVCPEGLYNNSIPYDEWLKYKFNSEN